MSIRHLGEWCNGSTTDSGSVSLGSNPSSPASANPAAIKSCGGVFVCLLRPSGRVDHRVDQRIGVREQYGSASSPRPVRSCGSDSGGMSSMTSSTPKVRVTRPWSASPASTTTPGGRHSMSSGTARSTREILAGEPGGTSPPRASTRRSFSAYSHASAGTASPRPTRACSSPLPRRHPHRRLSARAAPQGPAAAPRQPLHRRRRRPRQDDRGRPHRPRAAAPQEGPGRSSSPARRRCSCSGGTSWRTGSG